MTETVEMSNSERANELFSAYRHEIHRRTDRLFAGLMAFQWVLGIVFALWVSPLAWDGPVSRTHLHVWAALLVGGLISLFPALLGWFRAGVPSTRYIIAIAQMLMGALLIHLTGGRIETHFHVFGSLAFLAFYRDWRVLVPATVVVALDHMLRGIFWPQSVYGVVVASQWRWLEHAAWVVFEDIFLLVACLRSVDEMKQTAERTATLEHEVRTRQEAETDARNARARNDAILEVALDCVILMDESGRIAQFNPAAEATFGYTAAEAVGTELAELIVPADKRDAYRIALSRYLTTGDDAILNRRLELTAVRKGGAVFPVEVAIAPISSDGAPMFAGYMRDITERRRAEAALAERVSLASLTGAVGIALTGDTTLDTMLQQCTEAVVQHVHVAAAGIWTLNEQDQLLRLQAIGGTCGHLFKGMSHVPVGSLTIGSIAQKRKRQVSYASDVDPQPGSEHRTGCDDVADFAGYPLVLDSKLVGVMAVFSRHELSPSALDAMASVGDGIALGIERKRAEGELARHAEQLAALVEELRVTQRQAEAATRAKSEFLASMSHELRTPLNAIILYSELLQEEAQDHGNESAIADLQRIQSAGKHLLDLINGILDLSKIEAGKMGLSLEHFDVRTMIDELVDTVSLLVQKNSNCLKVNCADDIGTIYADLTKTRQILLNLLSNASKFTKLGAITVEVRHRSIDGIPSIEFGVTDTGVGMTEAQTLKVFDAFTQADVSTTRKYGGTGLGLAIVSRFCELMGGAVSVKSRLGEGSRFVVQLPIEVVDTSAESMASAGVA